MPTPRPEWGSRGSEEAEEERKEFSPEVINTLFATFTVGWDSRRGQFFCEIRDKRIEDESVIIPIETEEVAHYCVREIKALKIAEETYGGIPDTALEVFKMLEDHVLGLSDIDFNLEFVGLIESEDPASYSETVEHNDVKIKIGFDDEKEAYFCEVSNTTEIFSKAIFPVSYGTVETVPRAVMEEFSKRIQWISNNDEFSEILESVLKMKAEVIDRIFVDSVLGHETDPEYEEFLQVGDFEIEITWDEQRGEYVATITTKDLSTNRKVNLGDNLEVVKDVCDALTEDDPECENGLQLEKFIKEAKDQYGRYFERYEKDGETLLNVYWCARTDEYILHFLLKNQDLEIDYVFTSPDIKLGERPQKAKRAFDRAVELSEQGKGQGEIYKIIEEELPKL